MQLACAESVSDLRKIITFKVDFDTFLTPKLWKRRRQGVLKLNMEPRRDSHLPSRRLFVFSGLLVVPKLMLTVATASSGSPPFSRWTLRSWRGLLPCRFPPVLLRVRSREGLKIEAALITRVPETGSRCGMCSGGPLQLLTAGSGRGRRCGDKFPQD